MLTYGSTFSGIGGLDIAVERTFAAEPLWHVEPDPYASAVLARHWPGVPNLGRIEEVEHAEDVDIICGGFPCQDISLAGEGAGLDGARSGLWWELARVIGILRPRVVVLENVAALAVRGLDAVIGMGSVSSVRRRRPAPKGPDVHRGHGQRRWPPWRSGAARRAHRLLERQ